MLSSRYRTYFQVKPTMSSSRLCYHTVSLVQTSDQMIVSSRMMFDAQQLGVRYCPEAVGNVEIACDFRAFQRYRATYHHKTLSISTQNTQRSRRSNKCPGRRLKTSIAQATCIILKVQGPSNTQDAASIHTPRIVHPSSHVVKPTTS